MPEEEDESQFHALDLEEAPLYAAGPSTGVGHAYNQPRTGCLTRILLTLRSEETPHTRKLAWAVLLLTLLTALLLAVTIVVALAARPPSPPSAQDLISARGRLDVAAFVSTTIDPTADPCQDFYRFSCGGWVDNFNLYSAHYDITFSAIWERNRGDIDTILAEKWPLAGPLYDSCMTREGSDAAGVAPLQPILDLIQVPDPTDADAAAAHWFVIAATLRRHGVSAPPAPPRRTPRSSLVPSPPGTHVAQARPSVPVPGHHSPLLGVPEQPELTSERSLRCGHC